MPARKRQSAVQRMIPLSDNFTHSFELFSAHIAQCNCDRDIRIYNIALLTNCVAYIETELNLKLQCLQTMKAFREADFHEIDEMSNISSVKKHHKIHQKWDKIKDMETSTDKWNDGNSIYSNFNALYSLRNEVLHYKCDYLEALEVPVKSIESIMYQVCDEQPFGSKPGDTWMDESWCEHLLKQKKLAEWCITTTSKLKDLL